MKVEVDPDDVRSYEVQSRGRINLGTEYAGKTVEIAILDVHDEE